MTRWQWWIAATTLAVAGGAMAIVVGLSAMLNTVPLVHVVGMGVVTAGFLVLELCVIALTLSGRRIF